MAIRRVDRVEYSSLFHSTLNSNWDCFANPGVSVSRETTILRLTLISSNQCISERRTSRKVWSMYLDATEFFSNIKYCNIFEHFWTIAKRRKGSRKFIEKLLVSIFYLSIYISKNIICVLTKNTKGAETNSLRSCCFSLRPYIVPSLFANCNLSNLADRKTSRNGKFRAWNFFRNGQAEGTTFRLGQLIARSNSFRSFSAPRLFTARAIREAYLPVGAKSFGAAAETKTRTDCRPTRNRARCELHFHIAATILWRSVVRLHRAMAPTKKQFSTARQNLICPVHPCPPFS